MISVLIVNGEEENPIPRPAWVLRDIRIKEGETTLRFDNSGGRGPESPGLPPKATAAFEVTLSREELARIWAAHATTP